MNVGCDAARRDKHIIIELYARVTASWRESSPGRKQHFIFEDLTHGRPPHLRAVFSLWDQSEVWDLDSRPFLFANDEGTYARALGRLTRHGTEWVFDLLSIWAADWDDIQHVAGIYDPLAWK